MPAFSRIPGLVLPSGAFSDCLTIVEFLHCYGRVLGFEVPRDVPSLCTLQEGLFGVDDSLGEVQDLLVRLLQAALYDPGLPSYCQVRGRAPWTQSERGGRGAGPAGVGRGTQVPVSCPAPHFLHDLGHCAARIPPPPYPSKDPPLTPPPLL